MPLRPPSRVKKGDELTAGWLNALRDWAVRNTISLGANSGLAMSEDDSGKILRAAAMPASTVYFCLPTSLGAATGSWPSLTPASQSLDIYQANGSSLTKIATSATVYNWYKAAAAASKVALVIPDGVGNYVLVAQSCT